MAVSGPRIPGGLNAENIAALNSLASDLMFQNAQQKAPQDSLVAGSQSSYKVPAYGRGLPSSGFGERPDSDWPQTHFRGSWRKCAPHE